MSALDGIQSLQQGNMRLISLEIFCDAVRVVGGKPMVGEAQKIVGRNLKGIGQPDKKIGVRYGNATFNPA